MLSITFPCFQLLLFPFKTSPVCDYSLEPEKSWSRDRGGKMAGRFQSKGQVCRRNGGRVWHPPWSLFHVRRFFKSYVRFFFSAFIISPLLALSALVLLFSLYSTSSASSPWSPSISKAAYLLAELNFWKRQNITAQESVQELWMLNLYMVSKRQKM